MAKLKTYALSSIMAQLPLKELVKEEVFIRFIVALGPFQTSNFSCAESNANERKQ